MRFRQIIIFQAVDLFFNLSDDRSFSFSSLLARVYFLPVISFFERKSFWALFREKKIVRSHWDWATRFFFYLSINTLDFTRINRFPWIMD